VDVAVLLCTGLFQFDRNGMEASMPDAVLGDDAFGEVSYLLGAAPQEYRFETVLVIQMGVHRRDGEVVVRMMKAGQPARELTLMVVVHVAQRAHTMLRAALLDAGIAQGVAHEVAKRLGAVCVTLLAREPIEGVREIVIHRNCQTPHRLLLAHQMQYLALCARCLHALQNYEGVVNMAKIAPCLWFNGNAEEAAKFYAHTFPDSHVGRVLHAPADFPGGRAGVPLTVEFTVLGVEFLGLNAGPKFPFTEAVSFQVYTADQAETDRYWTAITSDGGQPGACGWCKDRFGLSWQIVPRRLMELMQDPDKERARRAMESMMTMHKIDIEALERAVR